MIPQTGQKLGHGQQIFVLIGRRVPIDAGATLAHDRLGGSIELSQRYPGYQADVGRGQQFLGGDLPQLETMEWDPRGHLGHVVPGVSKILLIRATAQENRFHNSGELRFYREAQTDIPDPLFISDKSAWPRLPAKASVAKASAYDTNGSSGLWG